MKAGDGSFSRRIIFMCLIFLGWLVGFLVYGGLQGCVPPENDVCDGRCPPVNYSVCEQGSLDSVWICHKTGELCDPSCYAPGDSSSFCFRVTFEDCEEIELEWQRLYCPYLEQGC